MVMRAWFGPATHTEHPVNSRNQPDEFRTGGPSGEPYVTSYSGCHVQKGSVQSVDVPRYV
jgi:hypothetical protein